LATTYLDRNTYFLKDSRPSNLSLEEENELDALDMVIGLSSEERSYLLAVWRAISTSARAVEFPSPVCKESDGRVQDREANHS
jgi:hypothetical protein